MLTINLSAEDLERAKILFSRYPDRMIAAMQRANRDSSSVLVKKIKDNLSGPVLNVVTGNLRRNWNQIMPIREKDGWKGGAGSGRTEYAAVHEFGLDKIFPGTQVRAHARAQASRNTYRKSAAAYRKGGSGVVVASEGVAYVRAFTRNQHVKIPARPYARRALSEVIGRVSEIHSEQIAKAWGEAK